MRFLDKDSKTIVDIEHLTSLKDVVLEGNKDNPALHRAVEQLKSLNENREKDKQIKVAVH